jgi:hypothetical protein
MKQAMAQYQATGEKVTVFAQFAHRAGTWPWHLRVLIKVEACPEGTNSLRGHQPTR